MTETSDRLIPAHCDCADYDDVHLVSVAAINTLAYNAAAEKVQTFAASKTMPLDLRGLLQGLAAEIGSMGK